MGVEEQVKIAIPISYLLDHNEYSAIYSSVKYAPGKADNMDYVTMVLIDEQKSLQASERSNVVKPSGSHERLAPIRRKGNVRSTYDTI